jgi:hypothetical protein
VTREEFLNVLARLRCAPVGRARLRAPHKPLLLLWLFGRFAAAGRTAAAYAEVEEPGPAIFVSGQQARVGGVSAWMRSRVCWPIWLMARLLSA